MAHLTEGRSSSQRSRQCDFCQRWSRHHDTGRNDSWGRYFHAVSVDGVNARSVRAGMAFLLRRVPVVVFEKKVYYDFVVVGRTSLS